VGGLLYSHLLLETDLFTKFLNLKIQTKMMSHKTIQSNYKKLGIVWAMILNMAAKLKLKN